MRDQTEPPQRSPIICEGPQKGAAWARPGHPRHDLRGRDRKHRQPRLTSSSPPTTPGPRHPGPVGDAPGVLAAGHPSWARPRLGRRRSLRTGGNVLQCSPGWGAARGRSDKAPRPVQRRTEIDAHNRAVQASRGGVGHRRPSAGLRRRFQLCARKPGDGDDGRVRRGPLVICQIRFCRVQTLQRLFGQPVQHLHDR